MIKIIEKNRRELYDGLESEELYNKVLTKGIELKDILNNNFSNLKEKLNSEDFKIIMDLIKTKPSKDTLFCKFFPNKAKDDTNYYSLEGLSLYYSIANDNILEIFSFGELQPSRYILYNEGIFKIENE